MQEFLILTFLGIIDVTSILFIIFISFKGFLNIKEEWNDLEEIIWYKINKNDFELRLKEQKGWINDLEVDVNILKDDIEEICKDLYKK